MGRPTKCTPETIRRLADAIRRGATIEMACAAAGITDATWHLWMNKARQGRAPYRDFLEAIKTAEAEHQARLLAVIEEHAIKQWQAAAWILERRYPDAWTQRARFDVEHKGGMEIVLRWPEEEA